MATTNPAFLNSFFEQIESQVQFGDSKASLLVAGDAILLAVSGGLIKMASGCQGDQFSVSCMTPSASLALATAAAATVTLSLAFALLAARPARVHDRPPSELFLLSYVARTDRDAFAKQFTDASHEELMQAALTAIHGKARYATRKFGLLKRAIDSTLLSLGFMAASLTAAAVSRAFA